MYMTLKYGRECPDQKFYGWGRDGPMIFDMIKINYQWEKLFLTFDGDVDQEINQEKTGWPRVHPAVSKDQPQLCVSFDTSSICSNFIKVTGLTRNPLYFDDCLVHYNGLLTMSLGEPDDPGKRILEGITGLHFIKGGYDVMFENKESAATAQQQTGWHGGRSPCNSLNIAFDQTGCIMTTKDHFSHFELSKATPLIDS